MITIGILQRRSCCLICRKPACMIGPMLKLLAVASGVEGRWATAFVKSAEEAVVWQSG